MLKPQILLTVSLIFSSSSRQVSAHYSQFSEKDTSIRELPYYAALAGCGAVILSDKWLVTAAHCVDRLHQNPGNKVWVGGESFSNSQEVTYKKVIFHPEYKYINKIPINDIALLELSEQLVFSDKVKPIKVDGHIYATDLLFVGKEINETAHQSTSIIKFELKRLTAQQCLEEIPASVRNTVKAYLKKLEKTNICAKQTEDNPRNSVGESGSPVAHNNELVGLTSYVVNKDYKAKLHILTNVPTYAHWIKSITGIE